MKIHKFQGKNEQEIMEKIKKELGSSAIILNIKTVKGNWFSKLFKNDQVEITAATDEPMVSGMAEMPEIKTLNIQGSEIGLHELKDKISNMENLLRSATEKMESMYQGQGGSEQAVHKQEVKQEVIQEVKPQKNRNKSENLIYEHLVKQEVEEEVARVLLRETDELGNNPQIQDIIRIVYNNIAKMIGESDTIEAQADGSVGPQIVFFIGPTGVGKTTSIAKLTAEFSLKKEKSVALITADTYRIAAIEQLRTYAEILSVPLKVVYSAQELQVGLEEYKDKDYVFIDTAGRSHKNEEHIDELEEMLSLFPQKKVCLVLSATTKFTDLISIAKRYTLLCNDYSIIMTKTDETASAGTILNLRYYTGKPLSYVSFGQNVPDDIEEINGGKYAKILLGSLSDE